MSWSEFICITDEDAALEIFEGGMAYLESHLPDDSRKAVQADPRFWAWWKRYWANTGDAFVRASQHLSTTASRREAWETWKASMAVGLPPKSVMPRRKAVQP